MSLVLALASWSLVALGAVLFVVMLAAHEVGYWIGHRHLGRGRVPGESVGAVVSGVLGLLAFILALTLSFSSTRFNERRAATLAESNAIGTAWLRAEAIGGPRGAEIARLLQDYTHLRIEFVTAPADDAVLAELNRRTSAAQTVMWGHATAIARERADPVAASLLASLNDTFDTSAATRLAFETHLPPQIFWLLIGIAVLGMGALGYQLGLRGNPVLGLVMVLTLVWTVLIVDILDVGAARIGAVRAHDDVFEWTLRGFAGGVPIPPAPQQ